MTEIDENRLRSLYAPIAQAKPASRDRCPSENELLALVRREGSEENRLEVLDHVMACAPCRRDFDLLRSVELAGQQLVREQTSKSVPKQANGGWTSSKWAMSVSALVACAVLAVGVRSYTVSSRPSDVVVRGTSDPVTLIAPTDGQTADMKAPVSFVWHAVPRAIEYELELLDSTGLIVFTMKTSDTTAVFADASTLIDPSLQYRWWARAKMPSGEYLRSAMQLLHFQP